MTTDTGVPDGRSFTSTLLLIVGSVGAALEWMAFNEVGAATVVAGWVATVVRFLLRPTWLRGVFAVLGLLVGWWPWVLGPLFCW